MKNNQVKEQVLSRRPTEERFTVVLSGKASKKVDGLYMSDTPEMVLHNPNFHDDKEFMYAAIDGVNGPLIREMGRLLVQAQGICERHRLDVRDCLDRMLGLPRPSSRAAMRSHSLKLDARVAFDNTETLPAVADPVTRRRAQEALLWGLSPDSVKEGLKEERGATEPTKRLRGEKDHLGRQIQRLKRRIEEMDRRLSQMPAGGQSS